ncbi:MAG: hypothetical protein WHV26_03965 [Spirochaetota bacterium]
MIWNIVTLVSCLFMILFFRRLDRSNLRITKVKRYTSKVLDDFKKLAQEEERKFNDSTIELDIMLKKAQALSNHLNGSIAEIEEKLKGLDIEKTNLKKVEEDLKVISNAARDVNQQIEYIAASRASFGDIAKKINYLTDNLSRLEKETSVVLQTFNDRVRERSRELSEEIAEQINKLRDSLTIKEERILMASQEKVDLLTRNFSESLSRMEQNITNTGDAILENIRLKIDTVTKSVDSIEQRVESAERRVFTDLNQKIATLAKSIEDFEQDLDQIRITSTTSMRKELAEVSDQILELKSSITEVENSIFTDLKEKANDVKVSISSSMKEFKDMREALLEQVNGDIEKVYDKLRLIEQNIDESKAQLIASFDEEVNKIRTAFDTLNLHAISKKDEIVKAARKEAEDIKNRIEEFGEKFIEMEHRLVDKSEEQLKTLVTEYQAIELRFQNLTERANQIERQVHQSIESKIAEARNEFDTMSQHIASMKEELLSLEENHKIFTRTDDMLKTVQGALTELNTILAQSREESKKLDEFLEKAESIKDIRRTVERELKVFESRKEKLATVESEIKALMELADMISIKADSLQDGMLKIDQFNARIDALAKVYNDLENRIHELQEYETTITKNLESVNKADLIMKSIETRIKTFQSTIEKSEKKIERLTGYLHSIEENTLILKTREQEIREVKEHFAELEGLTAHIEERIKQVNAMFQKLEDMRDEISQTDSRLQLMFTETDKRMKQFADFLKAIESNTVIGKEIKGIPNVNINERLIKTVRELSNKGWSSQEIANKLLIDENAVRLIINTSSL